MDFIDVTAQFDSEGEITPLSFTWLGRDYLVESTGRTWEDKAGRHILIIVPGARIFELVLDPANCRWHLEQHKPERQSV
jgi:hypothetical protein